MPGSHPVGMKLLIVFALLLRVPAAYAAHPAARGALRNSLLSGKAPILAEGMAAAEPILLERLRRIQQGTDGSVGEAVALRDEIESLARELAADPAQPAQPPEPVIRDYLARRAAAPVALVKAPARGRALDSPSLSAAVDRHGAEAAAAFGGSATPAPAVEARHDWGRYLSNVKTNANAEYRRRLKQNLEALNLARANQDADCVDGGLTVTCAANGLQHVAGYVGTSLDALGTLWTAPGGSIEAAKFAYAVTPIGGVHLSVREFLAHPSLGSLAFAAAAAVPFTSTARRLAGVAREALGVDAGLLELGLARTVDAPREAAQAATLAKFLEESAFRATRMRAIPFGIPRRLQKAVERIRSLASDPKACLRRMGELEAEVAARAATTGAPPEEALESVLDSWERAAGFKPALTVDRQLSSREWREALTQGALMTDRAFASSAHGAMTHRIQWNVVLRELKAEPSAFGDAAAPELLDLMARPPVGGLLSWVNTGVSPGRGATPLWDRLFDSFENNFTSPEFLRGRSEQWPGIGRWE